MKEEIILHFLHCQVQIRLSHWQTDMDAKHRALGELYDKLDESIDSFVEIMLGKFGRPEFQETFSIEFDNPKTLDMDLYLAQFKEFSFQMSSLLDPIKDSDLLNKRDEILGDVNHTLYLLSLKF